MERYTRNGMQRTYAIIQQFTVAFDFGVENLAPLCLSHAADAKVKNSGAAEEEIM